MPVWMWWVLGLAALAGIVLLLVAIAHFPRDNSF